LIKRSRYRPGPGQLQRRPPNSPWPDHPGGQGRSGVCARLHRLGTWVRVITHPDAPHLGIVADPETAGLPDRRRGGGPADLQLWVAVR